MFKRIAAVVAALACSAAIAVGANLSLITGPQDPSQLNATINTLIQSINSGVNGTLASATADASTTATTVETTLQTYTLPASQLSANGQALRIQCWGSTGANANNKTIKLYFGGVSMTTGAYAGNAQSWFLRMLVQRRTATTQSVQTEGVAGTGSLTPIAVTNQAGTETLTSTVVIKCTGTNGTASATDITAAGMLVEQLK